MLIAGLQHESFPTVFQIMLTQNWVSEKGISFQLGLCMNSPHWLPTVFGIRFHLQIKDMLSTMFQMSSQARAHVANWVSTSTPWTICKICFHSCKQMRFPKKGIYVSAQSTVSDKKGLVVPAGSQQKSLPTMFQMSATS